MSKVDFDDPALLSWGGEIGIPLDQAALDRLRPFWDLLAFWNRRVDLTSYRTHPQMIAGLLIPSLALAAVAGLAGVEAALDVGSGAGAPGVPLAVLFRSCSFRLVEPRERRTLFIREAVREMGLDNVEVVKARLEDLPVVRPVPRVFSRGVDPFRLMPAVGPHLAEKGWWWFQGGTARSLKGLPPGTKRVEVPDPAGKKIPFLGLTREVLGGKRPRAGAGDSFLPLPPR